MSDPIGAGPWSPAPVGSVEQGGDRARADGAATLADREGLAGIERDRLPSATVTCTVSPGIADAGAVEPPLPPASPKSSTPDTSVVRT